MTLTEDEIEMLARRRMLKNVLDDLIAVMKAQNPRMAEQVDQVLEEYETDAARRCTDAGGAEAVIECIMETKQEHEPRVKDELRRME